MIPLLLLAQTGIAHEFSLEAPVGTKRASVAGTFNGWNKDADPMTVAPDGRTFRLVKTLPYGVTDYKFVLDGERWITDPKGRTVDDGNGNLNSRLLIVPADYGRPARTRDGEIARSALLHETTPSYANLDRGRLTLRVRVRPDDVATASVVTSTGKTYPLASAGRDDLYETLEATLPWNGKTAFAYRFVLDGETYGPDGLDGRAWFRADARTIRPFLVPDWAQDAVQYQIFPDRFANGDPKNDPKDVQDWRTGEPTYFNRFGGDAAGVRAHVPYLRGLGVTSVYFNPVFASPSNHRYEADDYRRIDPEIGTLAEFAALTKTLRAAGIRTVMDWALNHTSPDFFAFRDLRERGAASRYRDWYFVREFPVVYPVPAGAKPNYEAWYGFPSMPKLNVLNPATRRHLLDLVAYWRRNAPGLGGIRLDVANEVDPRFWRAFRAEVKAQDPSLWIVGENWGDSRPWLQGDQWDAAMNYPFRDAVLRFVAEGKTTGAQFADRLMAVHGWYPPQVSRAMMNLLGSHDTPRFRTLCGGDDALARLGAAAMFGWVGVPSIYSGDELGMEGGPDPLNRRPMRWDLATDANPTLSFYRSLARLRRLSPALRRGDPRILAISDDTVAWGRETPAGETALVVLNRAAEPRRITVPLPSGYARKAYTDALGGRRLERGPDTISLTLEGRGAAYLLPATGASRPPLSSPRPAGVRN